MWPFKPHLYNSAWTGYYFLACSSNYGVCRRYVSLSTSSAVPLHHTIDLVSSSSVLVREPNLWCDHSNETSSALLSMVPFLCFQHFSNEILNSWICHSRREKEERISHLSSLSCRISLLNSCACFPFSSFSSRNSFTWVLYKVYQGKIKSGWNVKTINLMLQKSKVNYDNKSLTEKYVSASSWSWSSFICKSSTALALK